MLQAVILLWPTIVFSYAWPNILDLMDTFCRFLEFSLCSSLLVGTVLQTEASLVSAKSQLHLFNSGSPPDPLGSLCSVAWKLSQEVRWSCHLYPIFLGISDICYHVPVSWKQFFSDVFFFQVGVNGLLFFYLSGVHSFFNGVES